MRPRIAVFVIFALLTLYLQRGAVAAVRCADADLSKLTKVVYVSPIGNDSNGCGQSTISPCKTIQQGIVNCSGDACGVLVRYGLYNTGNPVSLADGVNLYGGCIFDETSYQYRSTIMGNPAVQAKGIKKPTVIEGFVILGNNAVHTAEPSVALVVSDSNGLILTHNVLATGTGASGGAGAYADGSVGGNGSSAIGNVGGGGGRACPSNPPAASDGGGGQGAAFNNVATFGVRGVLVKCKTDNLSESVGKDGEKSGAVSGGGGGGRGGAGCMCDPNQGSSGDGPTAGNGNPGQCSSAGGKPNPDNKGAFSGTAWIANRGESGAAGQVGSGGGGGGSGGYAVYVPNFIWEPLRNFNGRPGGGGGGGGCGGPGGRGGQQGGASIPLVLFNSSVTALANSNVLIPGPGGRGGNGATGGKGGPGGQGLPGPKAAKQRFYAFLACEGWGPGDGGKGGNGGQGGAGSGGAGGDGGPSFGVALVNSPPLPASSLVIYPAQPGAGGTKGTGGQNEASQCKGAEGQNGLPGFSNDQNSIVVFKSTNQLFGGNP